MSSLNNPPESSSAVPDSEFASPAAVHTSQGSEVFMGQPDLKPEEDDRVVFIKYTKDGELFVPPPGSKYVVWTTYPKSVQAMGVPIEEHIEAIVSMMLTLNGICPDELDITWSDVNPYPSNVH